MSEEKKENRIEIEDLPQAQQDLTDDEAKEVKGGFAGFKGSVRVGMADVTGDSSTVIPGTLADGGPYIKGT